MAEPTLFDEASLALIASGGAGKDGKVYSVKPVPVYGAEQITNGGFTTDLSGWTINNANAANTVEWSAGQAHLKRTASTATELNQVALVVGKKYYVNVVVNNIGDAAGAAAQYNGSTRFIFSQGINSFEFIANNVLFSLICLSNTTEYYIDNVSIKEIIVEDGDFTFSRGSNLSATRVNASQLIEKGRENRLLQSNQFDTTWTKSNSNVTSGQSGYDGTNDAWKLQSTTTGGAHLRQNIVDSGVQTFSVYAKAGNVNYMYFRIGGTTNQGAFIDLGDGSVLSYFNQSDIIGDAVINSVGGDWYRISIACSTTTSDIRFYVSDSGGTSSAIGSFIYIQDAQLEQGLVATDYIETGASTAQAGILENTPRFDYSGGATCPSLLLEPSRTNGILQSEYFNSWTKVNVNITDNNTTSPEGLQNAGKITPDTTNSFHYLDTSAVNINSNGTASVYAKAGGYNKIALRSYFDGRFATFNLNDGTLGNYNTASASIEDVGNGWYRCSLNENISSSYGAQIFVMEDGSTNPTAAYQGDNIKSVYLYGFQLEPSASYPTSYIPTYGVSQTRAVEICGDAGDATTFNSTEGVLYAEIAALANDGTYRQILLHDNSYLKRIALRYMPTSNQIDVYLNNSTVQAQFSYVLTNALDFNKIAFKYKENDFALWVNGIEVGTDTSGTTFPDNTLEKIDFDFTNNYFFYGKVKQVLVFKEALSDTELIKLTTI